MSEDKKQTTQIKQSILWLPGPEDHGYPAAADYLSLSNSSATAIADRLRKEPIKQYKAKDIFRASGLSLLGVSNLYVERDRKKIRDSIALSPLLLVRDSALGRVIIADGYHRLCAVYGFDEDAVIPCKIV
jgi:hypothetical protein